MKIIVRESDNCIELKNVTGSHFVYAKHKRNGILRVTLHEGGGFVAIPMVSQAGVCSWYGNARSEIADTIEDLIKGNPGMEWFAFKSHHKAAAWIASTIIEGVSI